MELQTKLLLKLPQTHQETVAFTMKVYKNSLVKLGAKGISIPGSQLLELTEIIVNQTVIELTDLINT